MNETETQSQLQIVLFVLEGCAACHALQTMFERVLSRENMADFKKIVAVHRVEHGSHCEFTPARLVRPRVFPTLIAYKGLEAVFGWEGFALLAPEDIQEDIVFDVLVQIFSLVGLSDEFQKNWSPSAKDKEKIMIEAKST